MNNWHKIAANISAVTGDPFEVKRFNALGGGCINEAYCISDGKQRFFVKLNTPERLFMFEAEAAGLEEISRSQTLYVPKPVCSGSNKDQAWLVLEYLEINHSSGKGMGALGTGLAQMHKCNAKQYGWKQDNTIGYTPQINACASNWTEFWRNNRLGYQLRLARENGYTGKLQQSGQRLMAKLDTFYTDANPVPSLLHGDLWNGNISFNKASQPVLFDPAVYYGDRETDIAMTELFGGFSDAFYAAYQEAFPLDAGYSIRKTLYNLYHILNHLNLFGGGYLHQAEQMIAKLVSEVV